MAVTLETIMNKLNDMEKQPCSVKKMFKSKIDQLKADLMASIDLKIKSVKDDIQLELGEQRAKYNSLKHDLETLIGKVNVIPQLAQGGSTYQWEIPIDALSCPICR